VYPSVDASSDYVRQLETGEAEAAIAAPTGTYPNDEDVDFMGSIYSVSLRKRASSDYVRQLESGEAEAGRAIPGCNAAGVCELP
jgi:hypothetical protein